MTRAQIAYLKRKDVPARKALQEAVDQLGFKVTLDDSCAPFKTAGYLPCTLDGEDAGFDMRFQDVAADISPALKASIGSRDTAIGSVGQAIRASSLPRSQFARRLSSNSAPSSMSRIKTCCYRSISCLPRRETRKGPFSHWSGKNAGGYTGRPRWNLSSERAGPATGTIEMKIWAKFTGVDGSQARREHFVIRRNVEPSRIKDFGLTLGEGKSV